MRTNFGSGGTRIGRSPTADPSGPDSPQGPDVAPAGRPGGRFILLCLRENGARWRTLCLMVTIENEARPAEPWLVAPTRFYSVEFLCNLLCVDQRPGRIASAA